MSKKQGHLEIIQGVVNRLSHNSFLLKGWTVVLVSALLALWAKNENPLFISFAYFPSIAFWWLDAYFLSQERSFRALYNHVRTLPDSDIDYSMDTPDSNIDHLIGWMRAFSSKTLLIFYGAILSLIIFMTTSM